MIVTINAVLVAANATSNTPKNTRPFANAITANAVMITARVPRRMSSVRIDRMGPTLARQPCHASLPPNRRPVPIRSP